MEVEEEQVEEQEEVVEEDPGSSSYSCRLTDACRLPDVGISVEKSQRRIVDKA